MNKNESLSRAEALRDEIFRAYNLIQFLGGDDHSVTLPKEGDWVKWIANEIDRAAHPSSVCDRPQEDYAIALQQAIELHCQGQWVPKEVANRCPHHAQLLNSQLK